MVVLWGRAESVLGHGLRSADGAAAGGVTAAGVIPVRCRATDPVIETVLVLITRYAAAYVLGEVPHVSLVMAVIVAGLAIGARRDRITTAQIRLQLRSVTRRSSSCWKVWRSASSACSCRR